MSSHTRRNRNRIKRHFAPYSICILSYSCQRVLARLYQCHKKDIICLIPFDEGVCVCGGGGGGVRDTKEDIEGRVNGIYPSTI